MDKLCSRVLHLEVHKRCKQDDGLSLLGKTFWDCSFFKNGEKQIGGDQVDSRNFPRRPIIHGHFVSGLHPESRENPIFAVSLI